MRQVQLPAVAPETCLLRMQLRRRDFLLRTAALTVALGLAAPFAAKAQLAAPDLDGFLALSTLLTGIDTGAERETGQRYLDNLLARPDTSATLSALWQRSGFGGAAPPGSIADLQQRGIYADAALQALADSITLQWYSGSYQLADGSTRVATFTTALAWRTLPYRPAGPSTCGGAFGHWAELPAQV
jgi:hypothetical protein